MTPWMSLYITIRHRDQTSGSKPCTYHEIRTEGCYCTEDPSRRNQYKYSRRSHAQHDINNLASCDCYGV